MKKYLSIIVLASIMIFAGNAYNARAEDGSGGDNHPFMKGELKNDRQDFKSNMQGDREEFRQKIETERAGFKANLDKDKQAFMTDLQAKKEAWKNAKIEIKQKFCEGAKEMLTKRFQFAIDRLTEYQAKVADIIVKLKADGKDTTLAQEALDLSKQKLSDAKAQLVVIKGLVPDTCENLTPELFQTIKADARIAKDELKESREALHQAVQEIRSLKGEDVTAEHGDDNHKSGDNQ